MIKFDRENNMAGVVKTTTNLTGLAVAAYPHNTLKQLYQRTLRVLQKMPPTAAYRQHTEKILASRLEIVEKEPDLEKLEKKIACGQVEEVIKQAQREHRLALKMLEWEPWKPLIAEAPRDQWKWPHV